MTHCRQYMAYVVTCTFVCVFCVFIGLSADTPAMTKHFWHRTILLPNPRPEYTEPEPFPDKCNHLDGFNEWNQYQVWLNKKLGLSVDTKFETTLKILETSPMRSQMCTVPRAAQVVKDYQYNTTFSVQRYANVNYVRVILTEYYKGALSDGGAGLRIELTNLVFKNNCPVVDYMNGTYVACCTVAIKNHLKHYSVTVILQFVNYQAFDSYQGLHKTIWKRQFDALVPEEAAHYRKVKVEHLLDGYWYHADNRSIPDQYTLLNGSQVSLISKEELQACVHEKFNNSLTVMGDSHLRFLFTYLLRELNVHMPFLPKLGKDYHNGNYYFMRSNFCSDQKMKLQQYINTTLHMIKSSPTKHYVLLFGGNSWDILRTCHVNNLSCTRRAIVPLVKEITVVKNVRVIWLETPPYPVRIPLPQHRRPQNSFTQGAINYFIANELREVGVEVVPVWGLTLPWADQELSGNTHIMEVNGNELLTIPPADVVTYYAMHVACSGRLAFS